MDKKWRYDKNNLKKLHKDSGLNMSYEEFKRWAEQYANSLISKTKKEIEDEKTIEQ